MNWINQFFLGLVMLPSKLYRMWGINTDHLRAILTIKLVMDDRRPNTIQSRRQYQGGEKEISNATLGTMMLSFLMGLVYLSVFMLGEDYVTKFTLYFSLFITFLCMTLVSDFTSVLIDVRDTNIILPKPVNDRSFVTARLLHIFIHICKLVIPMGVPCLIYLGIKSPWYAGLAYLLVMTFATLFSIFLINAVYILILRITTPEKFKNIITSIQIVFAILIYGAYQILPQMMNTDMMQSFSVGTSPLLLGLPPYWFACAFNTLLTGQAAGIEWLAAFFAITLPVASIYVVVKFLAPAFNQKLAMISGSSDATQSAKPATLQQQKKGLVERMAGWLTTNPAEKAGFLFTWKMMARSRDFRVKVYPSIGYFVVILGMSFYKNMRRSNFTADFSDSFLPIVAVYFSSMILIVAVSQMIYSEKYKAAWIFFVAPVSAPGEIISGAIKAAMAQFFSLIALVVLLLGLWLGGIDMLPNLLLALSNQLLINYAIAAIGFKQLPFSQPYGAAQQGGQFMRGIFMMLISGVVGVIHYFVFHNPMAVGISLLVSITALGLVMYSIRKVSWATLPVPE